MFKLNNSEEHVPPVTDNVISNIRTRKEIKYLKLKPSKNYEILENSQTCIMLKVFAYPLYDIKHHMFRTFFISLCCQHMCNNCHDKGQICFLNNNFEFKLLYLNESNLSFSIESNEINFGYAITMEVFLTKSGKLNNISVKYNMSICDTYLK